MSFHVGQKVVCVRATTAAYVASFFYIKQWPKKGAIYTVREIVSEGDTVGFYLAEIVNPPAPTNDGRLEQGFAVEWFRPITEKKTDISIFTAMLDPKRVSEPVV